MDQLGILYLIFVLMITIIIGIIVSGSWKKLKRTFLEPIQQLLVLVCCINWANRYIFYVNASLIHSFPLHYQKEFQPVKYFSIDRVFRNETLDATHLAEFHQIEGVVADYDLTLGDLMGSLHAFFSKMGIFNFPYYI